MINKRIKKRKNIIFLCEYKVNGKSFNEIMENVVAKASSNSNLRLYQKANIS